MRKFHVLNRCCGDVDGLPARQRPHSIHVGEAAGTRNNHPIVINHEANFN